MKLKNLVMRCKVLAFGSVSFGLCFMLACGEKTEDAPEIEKEEVADSRYLASDSLANGEPKHIEVQHILISFAGRRTKATRSQGDAQLLALEVLQESETGNFDSLVVKYTDDSFPGIYKMRNRGVPKDDQYGLEYERDGMVPAFGNVGFLLDVGEIGMSNFHTQTSPYGWHIIKRLR